MKQRIVMPLKGEHKKEKEAIILKKKNTIYGTRINCVREMNEQKRENQQQTWNTCHLKEKQKKRGKQVVVSLLR